MLPTQVAERKKSLTRLTPQPFPPKLRLSNYMQSKTHCIRILALLLGIIFLGAQFHFCTDLTAVPFASHVCPVCSTAGSATPAAAPINSIVPIMNPPETASFGVFGSSPGPRATPPPSPPPPQPTA